MWKNLNAPEYPRSIKKDAAPKVRPAEARLTEK